jgi:hypothetical protein
VAAASDSLEQIIRDELRAPVSELVRQVVIELVREQLNGAAEVQEKTPSHEFGETISGAEADLNASSRA